MSLTSKERRQRRAIKSRLHIRELGVARLTVHRTPRHIYAQVFDAIGRQRPGCRFHRTGSSEPRI